MSYDRRALAIRTAKLRSKSTRPTSEVGWCLREVRECYANIPAIANSAHEAWEQSQFKHRTTIFAEIPRGVPIFWSGGSDGNGHIAIATGFGGNCWSTDILRDGYFDKVKISAISQSWPRLKLLGWTEDLNRVKVYP